MALSRFIAAGDRSERSGAPRRLRPSSGRVSSALLRRSARPRTILEPGESLDVEALAPAAHGLARGADSTGDLRVLETLRREEHDPRALDLRVPTRLLPRPALELAFLRLRERV